MNLTNGAADGRSERTAMCNNESTFLKTIIAVGVIACAALVGACQSQTDVAGAGSSLSGASPTAGARGSPGCTNNKGLVSKDEILAMSVAKAQQVDDASLTAAFAGEFEQNRQGTYDRMHYRLLGSDGLQYFSPPPSGGDKSKWDNQTVLNAITLDATYTSMLVR